MGARKMQRRALLASLCLPAPALAQASPLKVLGTGAVAASVRDIVTSFTNRTGRVVDIQTANAGVVARRLQEGEAADLVLNSAAQIAALAAAGLVEAASVRELGRMLIGVAVRAGAARPDIGTEAALRLAILAAPIIALSDPATGATAGTHAARLIERLGLVEAMRGRVLVFPGGGAAVGAVAEGRAALAISQISEIIAVPGAVLVGPLPDTAQLVTPYQGAIATRAVDAEGARALLAALTGPEGQARFRAAGFAVG
ncbi:MAG: substrate-binding domain-containing protein [Roseomonas sp.]|nr:substrate-binding domain-containing protein [Roseomonas sp.]